VSTAALLIVIGRVVFGAFFLIAGIRNFMHFDERKSPPTNYGWKLPMPLTTIGFAIQVIGGLALILGIGTIWAAIALIVFLVMATELFHNFLMFSGKERDPHLYLTLVNITLTAGLLAIIGEAM